MSSSSALNPETRLESSGASAMNGLFVSAGQGLLGSPITAGVGALLLCLSAWISRRKRRKAAREQFKRDV